MGSGGVGGGFGEGQGGGCVVVPGWPLVEEPGAGGVAGLAQDQVEGGLVEVGEVGGEALGGAEGAAYLFDGGGVSALGLEAGAYREIDDGFEDGREAVDGVLDIYGMGGAVGPVGEVEGGVGFGEAAVDGGGEEFVPVGVASGEPAGGGVHDELLFGVGGLAPGVETPGFAGLRA